MEEGRRWLAGAGADRIQLSLLAGSKAAIYTRGSVGNPNLKCHTLSHRWVGHRLLFRQRISPPF